MIVYNQQNQILADQQNVWTPQRRGVIPENISAQSDCKEKSAVNSTADIQIEWTRLLG